MSCSERFVRNHKRQTDCAIHLAYAELASEPCVLEKFHEVLHCVRKRAARLFEAPVNNNGRHPGIDALVHLSRFRSAHIRPPVEWAGANCSWQPAVSSLAHHLLCEYNVPMFLSSAWYAADQAGDRKRGWFIAHSRGASFRSLDLPVALTRKMERIFLASHDHLRIEPAIRRAELLALDMPSRFAKAILCTRLAVDLRHGDFWRTVWMFLSANADEVDPAQIGPMIDFIQAIRHDRIVTDTPEGRVELDPPRPGFSIKGRTMPSMLRLMRDWHRSLGGHIPAFSWERSPYRPLVFDEPPGEDSEVPKRWYLTELTDSAQLRNEGAALHHCVASYADRCYRGTSRIWSLRFWKGESIRHVLTIEVDPGRRAIVQARGRANRSASGKSLRLLQLWASRERLRMAI